LIDVLEREERELIDRLKRAQEMQQKVIMTLAIVPYFVLLISPFFVYFSVYLVHHDQDLYSPKIV
jgi:CHASE3 domain sensor protein